MKRHSMRLILQWLTAMMLVIYMLTGCQSPPARASSAAAAAPSTLNNCYSLLHQLLTQEKDVSLLHLIKDEHPELKNLMKRIAAASAAGSELLEKFARKDPAISLNDIRLPPGEIAARDAIAAVKKKELLSEHGDRFQLTLLLSQTEALSYAWNLAGAASKKDPSPDRARALAGISDDMQNLYHEAYVMLLSKMQSPAAAAAELRQ
jgi:hypothetical protein